MWKWIIRLLLIYGIVLLGNFAFGLLAISSSKFAIWEQQLNPNKYAFWQNERFWKNPPAIPDGIADTKGILSTEEPEDISQIDLIVILLNGPKDIENFPGEELLGLSKDELSVDESGNTVEFNSVSLSLQLQPLPFSVVRFRAVVIDVEFLSVNFKSDCLGKLIYNAMIGEFDKEFRANCKRPAQIG